MVALGMKNLENCYSSTSAISPDRLQGPRQNLRVIVGTIRDFASLFPELRAKTG
jgi:hypothetical protein